MWNECGYLNSHSLAKFPCCFSVNSLQPVESVPSVSIESDVLCAAGSGELMTATSPGSCSAIVDAVVTFENNCAYMLAVVEPGNEHQQGVYEVAIWSELTGDQLELQVAGATKVGHSTSHYR